MGYKIDYDSGTKKYEITKDQPSHILAMTLGFFCTFLLLCSWFWPEGEAFIRDILIPGQDEVTIETFHNMTENLRLGIGLKEAAAAFCREVLLEIPDIH